MIKKGVIKAFDSATYIATVQIAGSLSVWLEGVPVSTDIPSAEMVVGRPCAVIFLDESNPQDACVIAVWGGAAGGGGVGGLYGINVEILSGDKTLTPGTDEIYQYLDEGGANRIITLATAGASAGDRFVIRHDGWYEDTHYLTVKQGTTTLDRIYVGVIKQFIFDGTDWIPITAGTGEDDPKKYCVAIGRYARAEDYGVAFGANTDAHSQGFAIGAYARGYDYGVGLGRLAHGYNWGVAIGYNAKSNNKKFSVALGPRSKTTRTSELARTIKGDDSHQYHNWMVAGWCGETTDDTETEIFLGGEANERFTIRAQSALAFTMLITARDDTANHTAAWKVEGLIKRDNAGNTVLVASTKTLIHREDATWDVSVEADDANEALIIKVTGDADNTVQWAARLDGVETHF